MKLNIYLKIILALFVWLVSTILTVLFFKLLNISSEYLAPQIGFIVSAIIMYRLFEWNKFWHVKLSQEHVLSKILSGLLLGFLIPAISVLIMIQFEWIVIHISSEGNTFLITQLCMFLIISIGEEIFFRGYLFGLVQHYSNTTRAIIINTAIFTLIHLINPQSTEKETQFMILEMLNIFLLGYLFSIIRVFTKDLYTPIALHFAVNVTQSTIFGFKNGGKNVESIWINSTSHDSIWNGSAYGLESSFILTIIVLSLILIAKRVISKYR